MLDWRFSSLGAFRVAVFRVAVVWIALAALLGGPVWAISATSTALTLTAAGAPVSAVTAQTVITLTATVQAAGKPVSPGQVNFCDATAKLCSDIHLLGTAQLLPSGTATIRFTPGPGTHSYRAVFAGTNSAQPSSSASLPLSVTGVVYGVTSTSIGAGGSPGRYTLNSTVAGSGHPVSPSGIISFIDTSYGNAVLATAPLVQGMPTSGLSFVLAYAAPALSTSVFGEFSPSMIALADFNGDGKLDAAVAEQPQASTPVSVLLGNGDGTMTPAPPLPVLKPEGGASVAIADFNGDGIPDMVVNLYNPESAPGNQARNELQVLLGKGDGSFSLGPVTAAPDPIAIVTGDFNGDGLADIALSIANSVTLSSSIVILLGNGDGTFTTAGTVATGFGSLLMTPGDFNQDGKADLAVTNGYSDTVTVLLGKGDGTFTSSPVTPLTGVSPAWTVAADFNKDGILDLAVLNTNAHSTINSQGGTTGRPNINILLGNGDGTFTSASDVDDSYSSDYQQTLAVGDFNGDGNVDLASQAQTQLNDGISAIAFGNGDGTFTPTQLLPLCSSMYCGRLTSVAAGDFNGDGLSDIASDIGPESEDAGAISGGSIDLATSAIDTSTAISPLITLPPGSGTHLVYASYPGDGIFPPEVSGLVTLVADPAASTLTLTATPQTLYFGQQVALSATVSPSVLFGNSPTGKVIFSANSNGLGKATGNSTFTLDTSTLPVGADSLSGVYSGDANFTASTSPPVIVNVLPADFIIAVVPSLLSVVQGGSGTAVVSLTALGSFTQTVGLSCSGLPINSTCTFSPATVTVGPNPVTSTMTIVTTSHHAALSRTPPPFWLALAFPGGLCLFALTPLGGRRRRNTSRRPLHYLVLLTSFGAALTLLGCGQNVSLIASPTGSSPLTVSASTTASPSILHSASLTLSVTP